MSMSKRQLELERAKRRLIMRVDIERLRDRMAIDKAKLKAKRESLRDFNK